MRQRSSLVKTVSLIVLTATALSAKARIGQSAITTYVFPWGARSLGMAETFTGIANNSEALFYNPAGLGQSPLAKSWIHMMNKEAAQYKFVSIAAKPDRSLGDKEIVWALRDNGEIYKFSGSTWVPYSIHLIDSSESVREIAEKYLDVKKFEDVELSQERLLRFNKIGEKAKSELLTLLKKSNITSANVDSLASALAYLPVGQRNETDIIGYIFEIADPKSVNTLATEIVAILDKPSEYKEMLELEVPFSLGLGDKATAITVDHSGRLWATTKGKGIWRFDGIWKQFTSQDGLPSDTVTAVLSPDENRLLVGTSRGLCQFTNGAFKRVGESSLKESVSALAQKSDGSIFMATESGLYKITAQNVTSKIPTTELNLSGTISSLMVDSRDRLWVGSMGNVSIFDGMKWAQYQFKGSVVNGFSETKSTHFWIATDKGAVEMIESENGSPEWKVHHGKNGLPSSEINGAIQFGKDVWLATGKGISQYKSGEVHGTGFFEQLLPSLGIDDIWHAAAAGVVPLGEFGTIGLQTNYLYFGEVTTYNANGIVNPDPKSSFEFVGGLSYGLSVKPDFSLGLSLKYAFSRLSEESKARSVAVDAGLLKKNLFVKNLSLGFSMLNMGPAVDYEEERSKDPIPFTMRLGTSYIPVQTPAVELLLAVDLERELVYVDEADKPYPFYKAIVKDLFNDPYESTKDEFSKTLLHTGLEFTYAQLLSARLGYMLDDAGSRKEMTFGVGLKTSVVLADFGMIFTLGENDIRNNQVRVSLTYAR